MLDGDLKWHGRMCAMVGAEGDVGVTIVCALGVMRSVARGG